MKLFYDGSCMFCKREIRIVRSLDRKQTHEYIDISEPAFDAAAHNLDAVRIHKYFTGFKDGFGLTEGTMTVYFALKDIGYGWLVFPLGFEFVRRLLKPIYEFYARWRIPIGNKLGRRCEGSCSR